MKSIIERPARCGRIAGHNHTNVASGRDARHRVPDFGFDAGSFVCDYKDVLAMVSLEVFGLVCGQSERKVVVAAQLQLSLVEFGVWDLRVSNQSVKLRPDLSLHLTKGR